MIDALI
jgi:hypothetical protein